MTNKFIANISGNLHATPEEVWNALTNPDIIAQYFFGTEAISDWKVGSPLHFKGVWEGKAYLDKGTILKSEFARLFEYDYISSFSGLEDKPENYAIITYRLFPEQEGTRLEITQTNIATEEMQKHSEQNWGYILTNLKQLLEK
ncbi:MAG: SRPBCC domain-containing protein [Bacteroidia bacterium]|nr:SRPBCC domain-containing protein [Bacteroidia bacterium]